MILRTIAMTAAIIAVSAMPAAADTMPRAYYGNWCSGPNSVLNDRVTVYEHPRRAQMMVTSLDPPPTVTLGNMRALPAALFALAAVFIITKAQATDSYTALSHAVVLATVSPDLV